MTSAVRVMVLILTIIVMIMIACIFNRPKGRQTSLHQAAHQQLTQQPWTTGTYIWNNCDIYDDICDNCSNDYRDVLMLTIIIIIMNACVFQQTERKASLASSSGPSTQQLWRTGMYIWTAKWLVSHRPLSHGEANHVIWSSLLTHWRRFDYAIACKSHRP